MRRNTTEPEWPAIVYFSSHNGGIRGAATARLEKSVLQSQFLLGIVERDTGLACFLGFRSAQLLEVLVVLEFLLDHHELLVRKDHEGLLAVALQNVRMNRCLGSA